MVSKCPHCKKITPTLRVTAMQMPEVNTDRIWQGLAYECPHCDAIISCTVDPSKIRNEITDHVDKALANHSLQIINEVKKILHAVKKDN